MRVEKQTKISNGVNKYIIILGQSPDLAQAELRAILNSPQDKIEMLDKDFALIVSHKPANDLITVLGGTIKIAEYVKKIDNLSDLNSYDWYDLLIKNFDKKSKNHFGFSLYGDNNKNYQTVKQVAFTVKKLLKENKYKSRLVTGQGAVLSSVIVTKNKLLNNELLLIKYKDQYILSLTKAVQDFASYGKRDIKRPERDDKSGMLPPKVAQMMINLAGPDRSKIILDPFCGSGTVLQEAMLLGYKKIYGSDISNRAVDDSQKNLAWLAKNFDVKSQINIKKVDVKKLTNSFDGSSVDLIVSEPFMGEARFVNSQKNIDTLKNLVKELQILYRASFEEFKKILSAQGQVVFVFPIFDISGKTIATLDKKIISQIGFKYLLTKDIVYNRPGQKVKRQITLWQKQ